jgi:hypothetical protein
MRLMTVARPNPTWTAGCYRWRSGLLVVLATNLLLATTFCAQQARAFALLETVEPERVGSAPFDGTWSFSERIVAGAVVALLALAAGGALLFRRRQRPDDPGRSN